MPEGQLDPANPWSWDAFAPAKLPGADALHAPHAPTAPAAPKPPRVVPQLDDLFSVQRNSLKVLNALDDLEHELGKDLRKSHAYNALRRDAENAYRVIRSYLNTYGS